MRKLLSLLALVSTLNATAQKSRTVAIFGYMRPSHPGIVPANRPNATFADYLVYVAHPKGSGFRISSVTIGGERYTFTKELVNSPVTYVNNNLPKTPQTITLVPRHSGMTEQLILKSAPNRPGAGPLKVGYTLNGKSYIKTLTKWNELEPAMNL